MTDADGTLVIDTDEAGEGRLLLRLRGEIDGQTCEDLERVAIGPVGSGTAVVLDLAEVSFVDSAGLRTMVALDRRAREVGGSFELHRPSRAIARLLELTSLDQHFRITGGAG